MKSVLVTGATGFIGRAFVRALLLEEPETEVWALARGKGGDRAARRPELRELAAHPRFHVVEGDLTWPGAAAAAGAVFGAGAGASLLPDELDAVFHLAAHTDFRESQRHQTFEANLQGTRNLLELLSGLRRVGRLFHVSTAYAAGLRPGEVVREELLAAPDRFANPYEESKHAAEWAVAGSPLDWTILRLSIVVGDSRNGEAESDKMMYGAFKVYWRLRAVLENKYPPERLAALPPGHFAVPGRPEVAKNLVCVDDVVRLLLATARASPPRGTVLHLVNPRPSSAGEMHAATCAVLGLSCLRLDPASPPHPSAEEALIRRGMGVYAPYLEVPEPRFDQARLRALLGDGAVDQVRPVDGDRLRYLLGSYLRQRLEPWVETPSLGVPERLALVRRHGRSALAYSSLRPSVFALPVQGAGYVPFASRGTTVAMVGDPVCAPEALPAAVATFLSHCARRRLHPVAVQVGRPVADLFAARGGRANHMGDEAEIDLAALDPAIAGGRYLRLRMHRNAAVRAGIEVREASYAEVPHALVSRVSEAWLERKLNRRELDLLLRPLPDRDEPEVRKLFAFRGDELVGFVIFNPLYAEGRVVGYYSDLERYRPELRGVRDLVLLEAARAFRREGREVLSLGLAPLWNLEAGEHPAASPEVGDLLRRIRDEVAPVYNFEGVSRHKVYWQPAWRPSYLCTRSTTPASDLLDVFGLIGLLPPEALRGLGDATLDLVTAA